MIFLLKGYHKCQKRVDQKQIVQAVCTAYIFTFISYRKGNESNRNFKWQSSNNSTHK